MTMEKAWTGLHPIAAAAAAAGGGGGGDDYDDNYDTRARINHKLLWLSYEAYNKTSISIPGGARVIRLLSAISY